MSCQSDPSPVQSETPSPSLTAEAPILVERDADGAPLVHTPAQGTLAENESRSYRLDLRAGEYLHLAAEQHFIDVGLKLRGPDDKRLLYSDSPTGRHGVEFVHFVAEQDGTHALEVEAYGLEAPPERDEPGEYVIRVEDLRPAKDEDRLRAAAWKSFLDGHYRQTLQLIENRDELDDPVLEARCRLRAGERLHNRGQYDEAHELLDASERSFDDLGDSYRRGFALNTLGKIYLHQVDAEAAVRCFERAYALFDELQAPIGAAAALVLLANVDLAIRDYEGALGRYRSALDLARRADEQISALVGLSETLIALDLLDEAFEHLDQALEIVPNLEGNQREMEVYIRQTLARAHIRADQPDKALEHLEPVLTMAREDEEPWKVALTLLRLGNAKVRLGREDEARTHFREAVELYRESQDSRGALATLASLGRLATCEEADDIFRRAHKLAVGDAANEASLFYAESETLARCGRLEEACRQLETAFALVENLRADAASLELRTSFFTPRQMYYDLYLDLLADLAREKGDEQLANKALAAHERRLARTLLDGLGQARERIHADADPELLAAKRQTQQDLNLVSTRLQERLDSGLDGEEIHRLERRQSELIAQLRDQRAKIRSTSPRWAALTDPEPLSSAQIRNLLDPSTAMLVYGFGREEIHLWRVTMDHIRHVRIPERQRIEKMIQSVHRRWSGSTAGDPKLAVRYARDLSERLLGPVTEDLEGPRRLVITGDGGLSLLPFAALPLPGDPGRPLVSRFEISLLPSASVLDQLRRDDTRRSPPSRMIAALADPVLQLEDQRITGAPKLVSPAEVLLRGFQLDDLERLPASREEAERIFALAPEKSRLVLGFEAKRDLVLSGVLAEYRYLHLASHGLIHDRHPELSGLVLSRWTADGTPLDGFLRVHEIYDLELNAELVTLSACRTGLGEEVRGEGLLGLTQAFLFAGSRRVMVTLWPIVDQSAAEWMTHFYDGLINDGETPVAALRNAQLEIMDDEDPWSNVRHWAPFVIHGDWQ